MAALTTRTVVQISRHHAAPILGSAALVKREKSTNLALYRRGRGGRNSFSGHVITVFGATGFLGRYVVNQLAKAGSQIIIPYRNDPYEVRDLKLAGELGQILFQPYHLQDEESIRKAVKYSDVVVNLVGRDFETRNFTFHDVHVDGASRLASISKEQGVEKFIHLSHLNAQPNPPITYSKDGSEYHKTKFAGEQAVREIFPEATILRPADMYGPEDRFIRYYANKWRRHVMGHAYPMWKSGTETVKMPIFVSDVAKAVFYSVDDPDAVGRSYDLVGPKAYQLSELVDYFHRVMELPGGVRMPILPYDLWRLKVWWFSHAFTKAPPLSASKSDIEFTSDALRGHSLIQDLGIDPIHIEQRAVYELAPFKYQAYYETKVGEVAPAALPKFITRPIQPQILGV